MRFASQPAAIAHTITRMSEIIRSFPFPLPLAGEHFPQSLSRVLAGEGGGEAISLPRPRESRRRCWAASEALELGHGGMQSPPASEEPSLLLDCFSPKTNRSSALFFFKVLADEYRGVFQAVFLINMASFPKSSDPELLNRTTLKIRPKNSLTLH